MLARKSVKVSCTTAAGASKTMASPGSAGTSMCSEAGAIAVTRASSASDGSGRRTGDSKEKAGTLPRLFNFDQLQGFATRAFNHHGAGIAERVGFFKEGDPIAAQFVDPRIEISDAKSNVILQLPA